MFEFKHSIYVKVFNPFFVPIVLKLYTTHDYKINYKQKANINLYLFVGANVNTG